MKSAGLLTDDEGRSSDENPDEFMSILNFREYDTDRLAAMHFVAAKIGRCVPQDDVEARAFKSRIRLTYSREDE
jgi:hypothetical protein